MRRKVVSLGFGVSAGFEGVFELGDDGLRKRRGIGGFLESTGCF
jgi:hypothetical protein